MGLYLELVCIDLEGESLILQSYLIFPKPVD